MNAKPKSLIGTGALIRLVLRRDRTLLPVWTLYLSLVAIGLTSATRAAFDTAAAREQYAATSGTNPGFIMMYGPLFGKSTGALVAQRVGLYPVLIAVISLLTVIRHTRTEEQAGRRELIGATVVGRQAGLAAALTVTMAANLVMALILIVGMAALGEPVVGSIALGTQFAAMGCLFAAVGAVTAQLTEGAGAARGIALGVLGAVMILRVVGDQSGPEGALGWVSWLSPINWGHQMRPFAGERWWPLAMILLLAAAMTVLAARLSARRDLGAGLVPVRPGPGSASERLSGPFGLAWRLHRGLLIGWTAGFAIMGAAVGSIIKNVADLLKDAPQIEDIMTRMGGSSGIVNAYIAAVMGLYAIMISAYAVQAVLRMRAEEEGLRAEPVLATAVGRLHWAAGHLAFAILGPTAVMLTCGLATGLVYGTTTGEPARESARALGAAAVQLPAMWLLAAVTVALFGLFPQRTPLAWGVYGVCLLLGPMGSALNLDQWVLDVSPFSHVPKVPGNEVAVTPLAWLLAISVALFAVGLARFRQRDIG